MSFQITEPRKVPRDPRLAKELIAFVDPHAQILRRQAGVGPQERLDPWVVAPSFGLAFVKPSDITHAADEDQCKVASLSAKQWSGMGYPLPDGKLLIMLNPHQTPERATVTVMEEVAHAYFGHTPVTLVSSDGGGVHRQFDPVIEREAYWLAAAALLPTQAVGRAVWEGLAAKQIAERYATSTELAEFRIKTLRLWSEYQKRQCHQELQPE